MRQFDAWIGDTERLIEDAAQWGEWGSEYDSLTLDRSVVF